MTSQSNHSNQVYVDEPLRFVFVLFVQFSVKDLMFQRQQCHWKTQEHPVEPEDSFSRKFLVSQQSLTPYIILRSGLVNPINFRSFLNFVHINFLNPTNATTSPERKCLSLKEATNYTTCLQNFLLKSDFTSYSQLFKLWIDTLALTDSSYNFLLF